MSSPQMYISAQKAAKILGGNFWGIDRSQELGVLPSDQILKYNLVPFTPAELEKAANGAAHLVAIPEINLELLSMRAQKWLYLSDNSWFRTKLERQAFADRLSRPGYHLIQPSHPDSKVGFVVEAAYFAALGLANGRSLFSSGVQCSDHSAHGDPVGVWLEQCVYICRCLGKEQLLPVYQSVFRPLFGSHAKTK